MSKASCIHCGNCCRAEICPAGLEIWGDVTPCPALASIGAIYFCGLLVVEAKYHMNQPKLHGLLGVGIGCGARKLRGKPLDAA